MMEIQLRLFLTTCMVNLAFTSNQLHSQTINQAVHSALNDEIGTQENVRNLLDSISKNDAKKSEIYREILRQDMAKEKQAFDDMKHETVITQYKEAEKMVYFLRRTKREIKEYNFDDPEKLEESFVDKFGDNEKFFDTWELMRQWYYMGGKDALRRFCKVAHKEAGMGDVTVLGHTMITWPRTLNFRNKKFSAVRIDVVKYEIEEDGLDNHGENPFFITRGLRPDCAYYLRQWKTDPHRYYLIKHVCGITVHAGHDVVHW